VAYGLGTFGHILPPYYLGVSGVNEDVLEAIAGNLVSPGRGLFVYSPILIAAAAGLVGELRRGSKLAWLLAAILLLHLAAISRASLLWWAGASYGPRYMSDVLPFLVIFLAPALAWVERPGRRPWRAAVAVAALVSCAIHARGGWSEAVHRWNDGPPPVDQASYRVWDWSPPQFLYFTPP